jgi:hypothetical protein
MSEHRKTLAFLAVAAAMWALAVGVSRWHPAPDRPSWQREIDELTAPQRRFVVELRAALRDAEGQRSNGHWPEMLSNGMRLRQQRLAVNYLTEAHGLRWLVLILEPDPRVPSENVPLDDEHHQLSDGTLLHVTVWTQALAESAPQGVTAFPAAEGFVERVK